MRALREALVLLSVAVVPAVFAICLHPQLADRRRAGLEPGEIRLDEVKDRHVGVLWIDARSEEDFSREHIPGAVHFDEAAFDRALGPVLAAWTPERAIVVYCSSNSCATSRAVAGRLRAAGLDNVFFLHGGWEAWQSAARH